MKKRISIIIALIISIITIFSSTVQAFAYTLEAGTFQEVTDCGVHTIDYGAERSSFLTEDYLPSEYNYILNSDYSIEYISTNPDNEGWKALKEIEPAQTVESAKQKGWSDATFNNQAINLWKNSPTGSDGVLGVLYKNVLTYQGESVDVLFSLNAWNTLDENKYNESNHMVPFIQPTSGNGFGSYICGEVFDVCFSLYFYKSGTYNAAENSGTEITVKGVYSCEDIDGAEVSSVKMTSAVEKLYASNKTNLSSKIYTINGGEKYTAFTDKTQQQISGGEAAQHNRYSIVFNGSSLTFGFCWQKEWNTDYWAAGGFEFLSAVGESTSTNQYIPTVPNTEIKKFVSDTDEKGVTNNSLENYNEDFTYEIEFSVNSETEETNFYKGGSFKISDAIDKNIQINSISIQNEHKESCEKLFDIKISNNVLIVCAEENTLSNSDFYGHTYTIEVDCSLKDNIQISDIGKYVIINTAELSINDTAEEYSSKSNTVSTTANIYSITIYYLDKDGNALSEPINKYLLAGTEYNCSDETNKAIDNYNRISVDGAVSGSLTKNEVIHVYYDLKSACVVVNYVDEQGNPLTESEIITGKLFDSYDTEEKQFENYKLLSTPENASGKMTEELITITYVYTLKETGVIVNYIDNEGNQLGDSEYFTGKVFDEYQTKLKAFYGYELIELPDNAKGKMTEETITVNYIYKLKESAVIVKHVDTDGNELAETETISGKVFDNYTSCEKQISGYKLTERPANVSGIMSENIITVIYIYEKEPEPKASVPDEKVTAAVKSETVKSPDTGNTAYGSVALIAVGTALIVAFACIRRKDG